MLQSYIKWWSEPPIHHLSFTARAAVHTGGLHRASTLQLPFHRISRDSSWLVACISTSVPIHDTACSSWLPLQPIHGIQRIMHHAEVHVAAACCPAQAYGQPGSCSCSTLCWVWWPCVARRMSRSTQQQRPLPRFQPCACCLKPPWGMLAGPGALGLWQHGFSQGP